jgi:hypothetical protein
VRRGEERSGEECGPTPSAWQPATHNSQVQSTPEHSIMETHKKLLASPDVNTALHRFHSFFILQTHHSLEVTVFTTRLRSLVFRPSIF